jgi:hypothetical protein
LSAHPEYDAILEALAIYLRGCALFPNRTQAHYWSLSCLPALKIADGGTRLLTLNMGMLEVLYVHETPRGKIRICMATDSSLLPARRTWWTLKRLGATMLGPVHRSSGHNAEYLEFKSPGAFASAMKKADKVVPHRVV